MSLVRPAELSSYRNPKLYSLKGSDNDDDDDISDFSTRSFDVSENDRTTTPSYFRDSPSDSGNSSSDLLPSNPNNNKNADYLMRLKLQELERALLDDDNNDDDESMEEDDNNNESPKESSSSSLESSNTTTTNRKPPLKELLMGCAGAISEGKVESATAMIETVRQMVSVQGEPSERIAAYMVEGLAARVSASGKFLYRSLKCKEPPTSDRLAAMQILFEVCPCFKFGFMAANGAILEALEGESRAHIIDFDVNQGNQYITLIRALAERKGSGSGPGPRLRVTGVDDPESVQRAVGGLRVIGRRLEMLAEVLGVELEFRAVEARTSEVTPAMVERRWPEEAVVVNFAFQLHHMPDESVSTENERDRLLRMVKGLGPKLVTVVEQDVNTNTAPFLQRFAEAYSYYSAVFESLDATMPRDNQDRANVERQCLARDIVNVVACEGVERIERYEVAGKWRARMAMAGFQPRPMSSGVVAAIGELISGHYCDRYKMKQEMGALHFGWENKNLIVASAWQ